MGTILNSATNVLVTLSKSLSQPVKTCKCFCFSQGCCQLKLINSCQAFFHPFREDTIKHSLFHLSWDEKYTKKGKNPCNRLTPPPSTPNKKHKAKCYGPPTILQPEVPTPWNPFTCVGIQPFLFPSVFPFSTLSTAPTCMAAKVLSAPHLPD